MNISLAFKTILLPFCFLFPRAEFQPDDDPFADEIRRWQSERETQLRAERGWLTLVGRFPLKAGENKLGSGQDNDIVIAKELVTDLPATFGSVVVDSLTGQVSLNLVPDVEFYAGSGEGEAFRTQREFQWSALQRDWVWRGRLSMHVVERGGKFFLRTADSQASTRTEFKGCSWYPPNPKFRVEARFVPYDKERKLDVPSIIDDVSQEPCPGFAEFELDGQTFRLDAIQEGKGLFFVFRDATAGDTTYGAARFMDIEQQPDANATFTLDFNKAYNPPCAFSTFTICPLPPKQNILPVRIEAGETYEH